VPTPFRLDVRSERRASVIAVSGELDLASGPVLEKELAQAIQGNGDQVIVDLRGLEFMDSSGLSILVRAHGAAQDAGRRFVLIRGPKQVQRLLSLTGVAQRLEFADAPDELLQQH